MGNRSYVIGVDIGGTNTDAVLVDENQRIIASCKILTTTPVEAGFKKALEKLCQEVKIAKADISAVLVGTTHAMNALLQQQDLYKVGLIRLAGHYPTVLPACYEWPSHLRETVLAGTCTVGGGMECQGVPISSLNDVEIKQAIYELRNKGAEGFTIVGAFSPLYPEQENYVGEIIQETLGKEIPLTLSYKVGGVGIIERENTALLNTSLKKPLAKGFAKLKDILLLLGIHAPLYLTQNNGTRMEVERALEYPVFTIAAGPTNSFIGSIKLVDREDAIVADIGGTSTDVGIVKNGFPRRSLEASRIAGVKLNFSMPDVLSIALGGGSIISQSGTEWNIGPTSVAHEVLQLSRSFGGAHLTMTDMGIAIGNIHFPNAQTVVSKEIATSFLAQGLSKIMQLKERIAGKEKDLPLLLVGGGAGIFPKEMLPDNTYIPPHFGVANAYGAALAEVSAVVDVVVALEDRDKALTKLREEAIANVHRQKANKETIRIIDQQVIPYHYVPGNLARVVITAAGKI